MYKLSAENIQYNLSILICNSTIHITEKLKLIQFDKIWEFRRTSVILLYSVFTIILFL